jgi:hypothetical protein
MKSLAFSAAVAFGFFTSLFAIPASGTPQAVTAEQCKADGDAWKLPAGPYSAVAAIADKLSYTDIRLRRVEMMNCYVVDTSDTQTIVRNSFYVAQANVYEVLEMNRIIFFIVRHHGTEPSEMKWTEEDKPNSENHPSENQCQKEYVLWNRAIQASGISQLSMRELYGRQDEMTDCGNIVLPTPNGFTTFVKYVWLSFNYNMAAAARLRAHLESRNEWNQFLSEDTAGKR